MNVHIIYVFYVLVGAWVINIKLMFRANSTRGEIKSLVLVVPPFFMASLDAHSKFGKSVLYLSSSDRGFISFDELTVFCFSFVPHGDLYNVILRIVLTVDCNCSCLHYMPYFTKMRQRHYNISSSHICRLVLRAHQPFIVGV